MSITIFVSLYCHTIRQKSVTVFGMEPVRVGEGGREGEGEGEGEGRGRATFTKS